MSWLAALLAWLGAAYVVTAVAYRAVFGIAWLRRARADAEDVEPEAPRRFALLIPAHDEELLVEAAIRSARTCEHPAGALVVHVIADNCTDRTAEVARRAGAEVWVREEPGQRGKGQALAWGLARLDLDRFDAVAVVDADNLLDRGFFREMSHRLAAGIGSLLQQIHKVAFKGHLSENVGVTNDGNSLDPGRFCDRMLPVIESQRIGFLGMGAKGLMGPHPDADLRIIDKGPGILRKQYPDPQGNFKDHHRHQHAGQNHCHIFHPKSPGRCPPINELTCSISKPAIIFKK